MTRANTMKSRVVRRGASRAGAGRRAAGRMPMGEGAAAVEAWFAEAGLPARVVDRCPDPGCSACGRRFPAAA